MNIIELEEVDSTNTYAKSNIDNLSDFSVIHARRQTNGRGRLNRNWIDLGNDNLFFTIVLKPSNYFDEKYPNLTQYMAVVICRVLEKYGLSPKIKWPNDVLINNAKISGILSETVIQGSTLKGLLIGVGINLNATKEDLLKIPNKVATALNIELKKTVNSTEILENLLNEFENGYKKFLEDGFASISTEYIEKICSLNKKIEIQIFNDIKTGFAKTITSNGELVLITEDNKESVLTIGDIL